MKKMKKEKKQRERRNIGTVLKRWGKILENNIYSFRYMWHGSKGYFFASIANAIITGLIGPLLLLLNRQLYNMLSGDKPVFVYAIYIIAGIFVVNTVSLTWRFLSNDYIMPKLSEQLHMQVQTDLFEKARMIELERYDDTEFYNGFILAMQYADTYATGTVGNFTNLISNLIAFLGTIALIVYIDVGTVVILIASALLSMLISVKQQKNTLKMNEKQAPIMRRSSYVNRLFMLPDYAKELRLTDVSECLLRDYKKSLREHIAVIRKYKLRDLLWGALLNINNFGAYIAVIVITLYKFAVLGTVTIGDFTVIVDAGMTVRDNLGSLVGSFSNLPAQSDQIDRVRALMDYKPSYRGGTLPAPHLESLELKNVSFAYLEGDEVLHDVSMKISRGEKIAIVGYNGAGKSTLIKLIMRLYDPKSGCILLNGVDAREYETESYRGRIGAVFQDYRIFAATVAENVLGDRYDDSKEGTVLEALHRATFDDKLAELEGGINTMLTREFDEKGTNLSGGEEQKIAIARVFAGDYDLIIMDEPSAALDPMAEYALNKQIAAFAEDKTVIFISHRLSTTRHADRIYMFESGRVVECGSHNELMRQNGRYAEMFTAQAENYIRGKC